MRVWRGPWRVSLRKVKLNNGGNSFMAKMRVHELAKELKIKSQDIIDTLSTTDYAVKSATSNVDDAGQEIVRKKYAKASSPAPVPSQAALSVK